MKYNSVKKSSTQPIADEDIKFLANSIYKTLKKEGCEYKEIIGVSSQLLGLVTSALKDKRTLSKK